ncbi:MAG: hypothetical protein ACK491_19395, partial [Pseudanabaena sp.]
FFDSLFNIFHIWVKPELRQICWSHLLRDFQAMAERTGASQEIGTALLKRSYRLNDRVQAAVFAVRNHLL